MTDFVHIYDMDVVIEPGSSDYRAMRFLTTTTSPLVPVRGGIWVRMISLGDGKGSVIRVPNQGFGRKNINAIEDHILVYFNKHLGMKFIDVQCTVLPSSVRLLEYESLTEMTAYLNSCVPSMAPV